MYFLTPSTFLAAVLLGGAVGAGCVGASRCSPAQIAPGIFQGCKPTTQADFEALHRDGIRTIISLEAFYYHTAPERAMAEQNGLVFIDIPVWPLPLPPREKRVKEALLTLNDPSLRPIFVHCLVGADRANLITALYRVYYLNWSPQAAWEAMLRSGFHANIWLLGLKTYFWRHARRPDWVVNTAPSEPDLGDKPRQDNTHATFRAEPQHPPLKNSNALD